MKMRLGCISYINALPFFAPFILNKLKIEAELIFGPPSKLNELLLKEELDTSFISTATFLKNKKKLKLLPFGIIAKEKVQSVLLFSKKELNQIETIGVTSESASSVELLKILCRKKWMIRPRFSLLKSSYTDFDAYLLIGDEALLHQTKWKTLDLAKEWHDFVHLPFPFAVLATFQEDNMIRSSLQEALEWSHEHQEEILDLATRRISLSKERIKDYFGCLTYEMKEEELLAIDIFGNYLQ